MPKNSLAELLKLSVDERLQLVEDLWDSIAAESAAEPLRLPVSDAQRRELRRRSEAYRHEPGRALLLDDELDRIEDSLG